MSLPRPQACSVKEALEILNIGRTSLYEEIKKGTLKARKIGSKTIFLRDELDKFLLSRPTVDLTQ